MELPLEDPPTTIFSNPSEASEPSSPIPKYILTALILIVISRWWFQKQKEETGAVSGVLSPSEMQSLEEKRRLRERMAMSRQQPQQSNTEAPTDDSKSHGQTVESMESSSEATGNENGIRNDNEKSLDLSTRKILLSKDSNSASNIELEQSQDQAGTTISTASSDSKKNLDSINDEKTMTLLNKNNPDPLRNYKSEGVPSQQAKRKDYSHNDDIDNDRNDKKKKKSKKRALTLHPAQAFVEVICKVSHYPVQMGTKFTSRKNPSLPSYGEMLRLDCILEHENIDEATATNDIWQVITNGFETFLQGSSNSNPFDSVIKSVRDASQWHARSEEIQRDAKSTVSKSDSTDQMKHVSTIMELLQEYLSNRARQWILKELPQVSSGMVDLDFEDDGGLFASDYADTFSPREPSKGTTSVEESGYIAQLCLLFEESNPPTSGFIRRIINGRNDIAQGLWDTFMTRLQTLKPGNESLPRRVTAVSQALHQSPDLCQVVAKSFQKLAENSRISEIGGKEWENFASVRPLLSLAAYTVPEVGQEAHIDQRGRKTRQSLFQMQLDDLPNYPLCIFSVDQATYWDVGKVLDQGKALMRIASKSGEALFRKMFQIVDKKDMFRWLAGTYQVNESLASMIQADLLSTEGFWAVSSSRAFLLGTTSSVISFCSQSLDKRFKKIGTDAFDTRYLDSSYHQGDGPLKILPSERRLLKASSGSTAETTDAGTPNPITFSGSTEFFFLVSGLLRISVFASLRTQRELEHRYNQILNQLSQAATAAKDNKRVPQNLVTVGKPVVASWMGWKSLLEEQDLASSITAFCVLQLEWLVHLSRENDGIKLAHVPDWMCRQPAHWLAHMARTMPQVLNPHQGGLIVEFAIELLQFGTSTDGSHETPFSPLVMTALIGIASAFVSAGVRRAKRRGRGRGFRSAQSNADDDDRSLNIYTSLDKHDLGVTVFTNQRVQSGLCPTLIQTFSALDIVEGLDVDRDSFDKFQVKTEIADLLLRLMPHPSGNFRESILSLGPMHLAKFASSVAAAIGYLMDDGFHRLTDVVSSMKKRQLSQNDHHFLKSQQRGAANAMAMARTQLLLLFRLSEDPRFASVVGGFETTCAARDLSTMVLHFILVLTDQDGGTNANLDVRPNNSERTQGILHRLSSLPDNGQNLVNDLVSSRVHAREEYGLDVSCLCHLLLALCARWHASYIDKAGVKSPKSSPIVEFFATNDDCDMNHIQNVYRRLIECAASVKDGEVANRSAVFESDGYIMLQGQPGHKESQEATDDTEAKHRRKMAKRDQLSHNDMGVIASNGSIESFLSDLSSAFQRSTAALQLPANEDILQIEKAILRLDGKDVANEDDYKTCLGEWTVSSDSFSSGKEPKTYIHYFDSAARWKALKAGRALMIEAKRIHRTLPNPHPDGAIFVCFEEDRMDLCRAVMTGPIDTPYALGMFTFDVFFPGTYPDVPPLVTFMTTGGGQTRFNPNLYQDGKWNRCK